MFEVLEQGHFPDGGAGCSLFMFQPDLLECHKVVRELAFAFVDGGIGTLTQLVQLDIGLQFPKANLRQTDTAEAAAEGLVKDGAIEGQLLKVALRQPDVGW